MREGIETDEIRPIRDDRDGRFREDPAVSAGPDHAANRISGVGERQQDGVAAAVDHHDELLEEQLIAQPARGHRQGEQHVFPVECVRLSECSLERRGVALADLPGRGDREVAAHALPVEFRVEAELERTLAPVALERLGRARPVLAQSTGFDDEREAGVGVPDLEHVLRRVLTDEEGAACAGLDV